MGWLAYAGVLVLGAALYFVCRYFPADLPVWMPWEFSWPIYLACALALGWFAIGWKRLAPAARPPLWRGASFVLGVVSIYAVVQTHYDYLSQHMFFFHRLQHLVLHHLGPFLIALGVPGAALWAGMPDFLKPVLRSCAGARVRRCDPASGRGAGRCLSGLIYVWLIPSIHTRVMLDDNLYQCDELVDGGGRHLLLVPDPRSQARGRPRASPPACARC